MEFGTRETLIALGMLLVLAILLDGIRRVRRSRQGKLRVAKRKQPLIEGGDVEEYGSELPGGGSRVVGYRDERSAEEIKRTLKELAEANRPKLSIPIRRPEQNTLDLGEPSEENGSAKEPGEQVNEVLALHVMAPAGEFFQGDVLLEVLLANDMRYGSRKIFHRHEGEDGSGSVLFSMANSLKPGTFDLNSMDQFTTPGVSFFVALDELEEPLGALDLMLETARTIAESVGGELKDETRSALTRQTIEHYRQRVKDFERRRLSSQ